MTKSLKEISWNVSEETYRADSALSYSTLARYEREGFNNLDKLFDKINTPSLTFGSAIDSIITGGQEEFDSRFIVADFPVIPDSIINIVKALFDLYCDIYTSLEAISDNEIITVANNFNYQSNWKPETRAKVIKEKGAVYYKLLYLSQGKTILDTNTYDEVQKVVTALKESDSTKEYFAENNPFDNIERLYQLKFKHTFEGIEYRGMMDLIIVDHNNKKIIPVDLKTSSKPEWDFYKSFIEWKYSIQAMLYWRLLQASINEDDYFKDFKLCNYRFIVVNKKTLTPLVWEYTDTKAKGTLIYGDHLNIKVRDPFDIGKELHSYLTINKNVPDGIVTNRPNNIIDWLNK